MRTYMLCAILLMSMAATMAEDETKYVESATTYISKHGTIKDKAQFESKWKGMLETAAQDSGEDEEKFLNRYIFDWMADRRGRFEKKALTVNDKLQACRLYLIYKNLNEDGTVRRKGRNHGPYQIPSKIAQYLTVENLDKFIAEDEKYGKNFNSATK